MAGLLEYLLAAGGSGAPPSFGGFDAAFPGSTRDAEAERLEAERVAAAKRLRNMTPSHLLRTSEESRATIPMQGQEIPFGALGYDFMGGGLSPNSQVGTYGDLTNPTAPAAPVPEASAIASAAAGLPPSTNDPEAREPVVFADGVPVPRPRPNNLGNAEAPTDVSAAAVQPGAPMSLAPAGMPAQAPADAGGGVGGILGKLFNPANAPLLLALGSGLSGAPSFGTGMRRASAAAVAPAAMMNKERQTQQSQAQTYQSLVARGVPPQEAMAAVRSPEILKATVAKYFETKPAQVVNGRLVREMADGSVKVLGDYSDDKDKGPTLGAGYQWNDPNDKSKGATFIKGSAADPVVKRASGDRQNAPTGYYWNDPEDVTKGVTAIKNGPAEKVTPEVAARLGIARSFLDQLPEIRGRLAKGDATGAWDAGMAKMGVGAPGELRRQIQSGSEALLRNLTGAGMNMTEAAKYVQRYELEATDTTTSIASKMKQLERELRYTINAVEKGRGGSGHVVNGELKFSDDVPRNATAAAPSGVVNGVPWSIE